MAANALTVSYTDLQGEVALALDWHRTVGSWSSAETNDFARINKEALQQFYYPEPLEGSQHVWSFMQPLGTLALHASYGTGTVEIAAGVVTLTDGTFPSWAASGDMWVDGGRYTVDTRDGDTQVTLDDTSVAVSAGTAYELIHHYYDLASDFGGMMSNSFTYRRDQNPCGEIPILHEGDLRRTDRTGRSGTQLRACVVPVAADATTDTRWQAIFDPIPSEDLELEYRYFAIPPLLDGSTHVYHYGGAPYSRAVIASYIDIAFQKVRDSYEKHDAFLAALGQAIAYDRAHHAVHSYGYGAESLGRPSFDLGRYLTERRMSVASIGFESLV